MRLLTTKLLKINQPITNVYGQRLLARALSRLLYHFWTIFFANLCWESHLQVLKGSLKASNYSNV
jgi:hypothetical protein